MNLLRKWLGVSIQENTQVDRQRAWLQTITLAVFAVYFYVFMEWLFFLTKPSFLDRLQWIQKIEVLFITAAIPAAICLLGVLALLGIRLIPWFSTKRYVFLWAAGIFPVVFLSFTSLQWIDNFTYTVLHFGIVSTAGVWRGLYGLLFLLLLAGWYRWVLRQIHAQNQPIRKGVSLRAQTLLCAGMLVVSLVFMVEGLDPTHRASRGEKVEGRARLPHILLFGGDGLNAASLSVYGYERDTTPNLRKLAETSLLAENAFSNAANSAGSVTSILTGKLPTQTRVVYNPNILEGTDAFQHLPGILRSAGYLTVEIAIPYYIDAYALNFQDSFAMVNQQAAYQGRLNALFARLPHPGVSYFLQTMAGRILDRLLHIFFVRKMPDAYGEVSGSQVSSSDPERMDLLMKVLQEADRPVFVHVHMMTTHGSTFLPRRQVFSAGQTQDAEWMTDFYDDSILDFDAYTGQLLDELSKLELRDRTVFVVYSDHNLGYQTNQRVPLLFHFPNGALAGRLKNNVQNLDIAPTILDYLGFPIPGWMEGTSLLAGEPELTRPIYSTGVVRTAIDENTRMWAIDPQWLKPPFYQFGFLRTIVCQYSYYLDLTTIAWSTRTIEGHTHPCTRPSMPDSLTILQAAVERLRVDGFDVTPLEALLANQADTGTGMRWDWAEADGRDEE